MSGFPTGYPGSSSAITFAPNRSIVHERSSSRSQFPDSAHAMNRANVIVSTGCHGFGR